MKRLLCSVLLVGSMLMTVQAAEYVVEGGDDWIRIAKITGHTVEQLAQMNAREIRVDSIVLDSLYVGKKIIYIGAQDINNALLYCQNQVSELSSSDSQYGYFKQAIEYLKARNIRYSYKPPDLNTTGIHYWMVLSLAYTWQQHYAESQ